MTFFSGVKNGMHAFGERISIIVKSALLLIVYLVGVGIPAIIARIVRKRFLDLDSKGSSWHDLRNDNNIESAYRQF